MEIQPTALTQLLKCLDQHMKVTVERQGIRETWVLDFRKGGWTLADDSLACGYNAAQVPLMVGNGHGTIRLIEISA